MSDDVWLTLVELELVRCLGKQVLRRMECIRFHFRDAQRYTEECQFSASRAIRGSVGCHHLPSALDTHKREGRVNTVGFLVSITHVQQRLNPLS